MSELSAALVLTRNNLIEVGGVLEEECQTYMTMGWRGVGNGGLRRRR